MAFNPGLLNSPVSVYIWRKRISEIDIHQEHLGDFQASDTPWGFFYPVINSYVSLSAYSLISSTQHIYIKVTSAFCSLFLFGTERMKYFILWTLEQANSNFHKLSDGGSTTWSIKDHSLLIPFKTKLHWYIVLIRIIRSLEPKQQVLL